MWLIQHHFLMLLDTVNFSKQKKIKDTLRKNLLEFQKSRKKHLKEDLGKPCILHVLQKKHTHTIT